MVFTMQVSCAVATYIIALAQRLPNLFQKLLPTSFGQIESHLISLQLVALLDQVLDGLGC